MLNKTKFVELNSFLIFISMTALQSTKKTDEGKSVFGEIGSKTETAKIHPKKMTIIYACSCWLFSSPSCSHFRLIPITVNEWVIMQIEIEINRRHLISATEWSIFKWRILLSMCFVLLWFHSDLCFRFYAKSFLSCGKSFVSKRNAKFLLDHIWMSAIILIH